MQMSKQLSVSLVNKPGRLAAMLAALNKEKVHFQALSVMNSGERGTIRFVPENYAAATEVLDKNNIRFESVNVLLIDVPAQPGAFLKICERLAGDHLNIDYAYSSAGNHRGTKGGGLAVVKVNDFAKAQRVLRENGTTRRKLPGRRPVHAR